MNRKINPVPRNSWSSKKKQNNVMYPCIECIYTQMFDFFLLVRSFPTFFFTYYNIHMYIVRSICQFEYIWNSYMNICIFDQLFIIIIISHYWFWSLLLLFDFYLFSSNNIHVQKKNNNLCKWSTGMNKRFFYLLFSSPFWLRKNQTNKQKTTRTSLLKHNFFLIWFCFFISN